jgi:hypothetical protein
MKVEADAGDAGDAGDARDARDAIREENLGLRTESQP